MQYYNAKNYVIGAAFVFIAYYLGNFITNFFVLSIPGPLVGLLLLLALLLTFPVFERHVATFAVTPLKHMSLLFVPAVLGVSLYWNDIQQNALAIMLAIVVTTSFCLGVTAWVSQFLFSRKSSTSECAKASMSMDEKKKTVSNSDD